MEATHLGAWMAGKTEDDLADALSILRVAPTFRDPGWLKTAFEVRKKYPQEMYRSLGIPTWFYGHEPSTPLATDIAKYFMNSVREDILLTISKGGIIYSPGSAGTMQEIFQDAAQNHYESFGYASPMVFFGKEFFSKQIRHCLTDRLRWYNALSSSMRGRRHRVPHLCHTTNGHRTLWLS